MIIPIELRFKADKGSKSAFRTEKTIKSHDVNSVEFHISIDGLELTDNHTAKILSIFHSSKSQANMDCEIVEGKIIYKPDTNLISRHEHVTNYVYVYKDNQSLDVREFIYVVDLSKIDETSLEVKEVYDQSYADLLTDFEQALSDYKDSLPQADSVRADIDEILNQFSNDSQAKLSLINEAESSRVKAEGQRVSAELIRVQSEAQRVLAEQERQEEFQAHSQHFTDVINFYGRTKNLLNYRNVSMNKKIGSIGQIQDATSNESDVIEKIKVDENTHYVMNVRSTYAFYDSSGGFIERFSNVAKGVSVVSPANSSYMSVAMVKIDDDYPGLDKIQIEQNIQITPFVPFSELEYIEKESTQKKPYDFSPLPINGSGYRMYNGTAFIQDNLTTFNGYQYAVWWSDDKRPIIGKRKLPYGDWETYDLSLVEGNPLNSPVANDGHNDIVVAVSADGHIHVVGNHHGDALRYVMSDNPENITSFSRNSLADSYPIITYPQFFKQKNGGLLLSYRDGSSASGNTVFYGYSSSSKKWSVRKNPVINGKITSDHGYLNHIAVDQFGVIHIAGTWRDTAVGNTNRHIFYAKSGDNGATWKKSDGTILPDPITINNCEIVLETPETDSGILNQSGLEVDYSGNPHIAYFMYDENEHTNIYHLYHDGTKWINEKVTHFAERLETGSGAWGGLLSRPSIFCYENRVFVIYRVSYSDKKGSLRLIEVTPGEEKVDFPIVDIDLNNFEPTFDTQRLYQKNELSILLIANHTNAVLVNTDDFTNQPAYVYTIDLEQIDDFRNERIELPTIKPIKYLTYEVNATKYGNFILNGGLPVPVPTANKKYYGRLQFGGDVGGAGTITSVMKLNGKNRGKSKTTGVNTSSSTGWVHLDEGGVLEISGNLDGLGNSAKGYYGLEIGEIDF